VRIFDKPAIKEIERPDNNDADKKRGLRRKNFL